MKTADELQTHLNASLQSVQIANRILDAMRTHNLDATFIDRATDAVRIFWNESHANNRTVLMHIFDSCSVTCIAIDEHVHKYWTVSDLSATCNLTLSLTLDETLEYIRHFLWANHDA